VTAENITEVLKLLPSLLWFALALAACILFYRPIRYELLPRIASFKGFGVEVTFVRDALERAIEHQKVEVSQGDRSQVLKRAMSAAAVLRGMRVLWVDDHPEYNQGETELLWSLGVFVRAVRSTAEATTALAAGRYDAIISDMEREGNPNAGTEMVAKLWERHLYRWTVIYLGKLATERGTPPLVFGITDRPDHLVHYIIDIAERERL
jgi:CheY-like chemotaxis protein